MDTFLPGLDQRGHLNRMLRLALPFFVDATFCAQTFAQMRRHPELAVWVALSRIAALHDDRQLPRSRADDPDFLERQPLSG